MRIAFKPASLPWLVWQECRLWWLDSSSVKPRKEGGQRRISWLRSPWIIFLLLFSHGMIWAIYRNIPDQVWQPSTLTVQLLGIAILMGLQGFKSACDMLGGQGDLTLLRMSPVDEREIFVSKLAGLALVLCFSWSFVLPPIANVQAARGHWGWLALYGVLPLMSVMVACFSMAAALWLMRRLGIRRMSRYGQILGMALGLLVFLLFRGMTASDGGVVLYRWHQGWQVDETSWWWWPGRAALGDPLALVLWLALAAGGLALCRQRLYRAFVDGIAAMQSAGAAQPRKRARTALAFAAPFWAIAIKDWRILRRNPPALMQALVEMVYLLPVSIGLLGGANWVEKSAGLAIFLIGLLACDLHGKLRLLDQAADLAGVSPAPRARLGQARALAVSLPLLALLLPWRGWAARQGVLPALALAACGLAAVGCGNGICLVLGKPTESRRKGYLGNMGMACIFTSMLVSLLLGVGAYFGVRGSI
ncbi:hypothetical protein [Chromobacterium sp. IIBBL 290-4]|uniref:hypothetical protein n=1 Tax=Chromobacterium sp. IIBBL 290-4 TaxID=2953890 RepID=UPI0020B65F83|nr:hypothetical protein [Chromobacterium sp. IIBBL 290-4]UTH74188.1 hypothetical protein NKT35_22050 [Chromobacterium sp. IIBBL 290-4]